jgi:DNA-binding NarL/FixJ family response regulator
MCVDDNELISEAIQRRLRREPDFEWVGSLKRASELAGKGAECRPDVVILDVDIPGDDTFQSIRDLAQTCPSARVLMLSGHTCREYVDLAVAAGAWGYLLKSDETDAIIHAIREVSQGGFVLKHDTLIEHQR